MRNAKYFQETKMRPKADIPRIELERNNLRCLRSKNITLTIEINIITDYFAFEKLS